MLLRSLPRHARGCVVTAVAALAVLAGSARAQGPRGGTAVVAVANELEAPNPLVAGERWAQEVNRFVLYLPLVRYTAQRRYEGVLASTWTMTGDTGAVFRLRPGLRWHDGVPITSADVVFTFERAKDPRTAYPNSENFTHWKWARAEGPLTVRFGWSPHVDPLGGLPYLPIAPRHALESVPPEQLRQAAFNQNPIGSGPFRFVEHRQNDRWVFEANRAFPAALGGPPALGRLVLRIIPDPPSQVVALQTGEADVVTAAGVDGWKALSRRPDVKTLMRSSRRLSFIIWNELRPPFGDVRVRRALAFAIDRQTMRQVLLGGMARLATGPIPPGDWAFDASLRPLPYAPDSARRLLRQAGYADRNGDGVLENAAGRPLAFELKYPGASTFQRGAAEMIQAQLARIGARVSLVPTDTKVYMGDIMGPERRFDAAFFQFQPDFRPVFRENFHCAARGERGQFASYCNPEVDRILDAAAVTSDPARALALWHRFQRILQHDQPWTVLYYMPELVEMSPRMQGVDIDERGTLVNVARWRKR